jgi:hypothetical protein
MNLYAIQLAASGAIFFGYLVVGAFFWRFRMLTRQRLFGLFAAAFWVLALERAFLIYQSGAVERDPLIYVTRLVAFFIIIWTIWDRNRRARP